MREQIKLGVGSYDFQAMCIHALEKLRKDLKSS